MRVFVVPSWHPTPDRPLWANWVVPHIEAVREAGVEAYVLQVDLEVDSSSQQGFPDRTAATLIDDNHYYLPLPIKKHRFQRTRLFYGSVLREYISALRDLYRLAVKTWGRPDVLHAHVSLPAGYGAAEVGKEEGIPVIITEHYSGFEYDAKYWWRAGYFVKKMVVQGFYTVSPGFADRIRKTGLIEVSGVLPNPIDTDVFQLSRHKELHSDIVRIVTAGNMGWIKGTDILFEALRIILNEVNWHLTIFGSYTEQKAFARWLSDPDFASRVDFPGKVSKEQLAKTFANSDVYVVSSRVETASVSMLEAMACGVPVVTTRIGAPETLIDDSVGVSVAPNDPEALAQGIRQVVSNLNEYDPVVLRTFVEQRYSKPVVARKMIEAYERALLQFKSS